MFKRPVMGGLEKNGIIYKGSALEIENEVRRVIKSAPEQFMLGAECTVPGDIDWGKLKKAIEVAHSYSG